MFCHSYWVQCCVARRVAQRRLGSSLLPYPVGSLQSKRQCSMPIVIFQGSLEGLEALHVGSQNASPATTCRYPESITNTTSLADASHVATTSPLLVMLQPSLTAANGIAEAIGRSRLRRSAGLTSNTSMPCIARVACWFAPCPPLVHGQDIFPISS